MRVGQSRKDFVVCGEAYFYNDRYLASMSQQKHQKEKKLVGDFQVTISETRTTVCLQQFWCESVPVMADAAEVRRFKAKRTNEMNMFTPKQNHLQTLLEGEALTQKLHQAYEELHKALEGMHKDYTLVVEEEVLVAEGDCYVAKVK